MSERGVDSQWHVTILAASAFCLSSASQRSSGFLYLSLIEDFGLSREEASWPDSLIAFSSEMAGVVVGFHCREVNVLPVMVTGSVFTWAGVLASGFTTNIAWISVSLGLVHGFGAGIVDAALHVYIGSHFQQYRGTAHGIMYAGASVSSVVFPEILNHYRNTFGLQNGLLLFGVILINLTVISFLMEKPVTSSDQQTETAAPPPNISDTASYPRKLVAYMKTIVHTEAPAGETSLLETKIFHCPMYYVILVSWTVFQYCSEVFYATLNDYATDKGSTFGESVSISAMIATTDIAGGLLLPLIADKNLISRSALVTLTYLFLGMALLALTVANQVNHFILVCLLVTACLGCGTTMYGVLLADYVTRHRLPLGYHIVGLVAGSLFMAKPFLIGYFRDYEGSYDGLYRLLSGGVFGVTIIWCVVVICEWRNTGSWMRENTRRAIRDWFSRNRRIQEQSLEEKGSS